MLKIKESVVKQICEQAERGYPYEICGFLLGKIDFNTGLREVSEAFQVENRNKERANDRFEIAPEDYTKVEDYAYQRGLDIVGIYHSHPDHPDRPSQTDLSFALPDMSYIIVSVDNGKAKSWKSWELKGSSFAQEDVEVI